MGVEVFVGAARSGYRRPLDGGLLIEARCFNQSITDPQTYEGLRQFNERDHPDRRPDGAAVTVGLTRGVTGRAVHA